MNRHKRPTRRGFLTDHFYVDRAEPGGQCRPAAQAWREAARVFFS